jgi:hypothetical protein
MCLASRSCPTRHKSLQLLHEDSSPYESIVRNSMKSVAWVSWTLEATTRSPCVNLTALGCEYVERLGGMGMFHAPTGSPEAPQHQHHRNTDITLRRLHSGSSYHYNTTAKHIPPTLASSATSTHTLKASQPILSARNTLGCLLVPFTKTTTLLLRWFERAPTEGLDLQLVRTGL